MLTLIADYLQMNKNYSEDTGGTPIDYFIYATDQDFEQTSYEFRVNSAAGDNPRWTGGSTTWILSTPAIATCGCILTFTRDWPPTWWKPRRRGRRAGDRVEPDAGRRLGFPFRPPMNAGGWPPSSITRVTRSIAYILWISTRWASPAMPSPTRAGSAAPSPLTGSKHEQVQGSE